MLSPLCDFSGYAFTRQPLDRADRLREDADAIASLWPHARVLVLDEHGCAFADDHGQPLLLRGAEIGAAPANAIFLGVDEATGWFCVTAANVGTSAPQRLDLRQAAASWDALPSTAFAYARGIWYWHTRTRYCGVCGGGIEFRRAGFVAHCPHCGSEHYPRVDPAVIVAVTDGEQLLLGRQPGWAAQRYSVIAGFVEPGESLEQAVAREVLEETQIRVDDCRYLGSQPWPFPSAMMLGFLAQASPGQIPQVNGELDDARWLSRQQVAAAIAAEDTDAGSDIRLPPAISIARALIEYWYHNGG